MNEPDDKPLHDWVRQSLDTYRPAYDPHEWARLQRTLKRRRWWRKSIAGSAGLLILSLLSWFFLSTKTDSPLRLHPAALDLKKPVHDEAGIADLKRLHQSTVTDLMTRKRTSLLYKTAPVYLTPVDDRGLDAPVMYLNDIGFLPTGLTNQIHLAQPVAYSPEEVAIKHQLTTGEFGLDSTSYRAVARNLHQWPDAVLVCDLTTSMYPYTTQLIALLNQYSRTPSIQGIVFFTDCDSLGRQTQPGGPAGHMFVTRRRNPINTLPILVNAARNTVRNEDDAENDVEALLFAQNEFPEAKHLILIADNISTVKDMALLDQVRKPVHVVLCGTTGSDTALAMQPDYYAIASQTNGSVHTLEDDLSPRTISASTTLRVGSHYYRYSARRKQFKLTPFDHRPKRLLKFIWF